MSGCNSAKVNKKAGKTKRRSIDDHVVAKCHARAGCSEGQEHDPVKGLHGLPESEVFALIEVAIAVEGRIDGHLDVFSVALGVVLLCRRRHGVRYDL